MTFLMPRLRQAGLELSLSECTDVERATKFAATSIERLGVATWYASTGGARVPLATLVNLRNDIVKLAEKHGFPSLEKRRTSEFDTDCAILLTSTTAVPIVQGEGLRSDVWAWLTCALVPHVALWRFPQCKPERLDGGVRNTLQRLWIRGTLVDRGNDHPRRWELLSALTEDAFVQLVERPSVARDRKLVIAIAEAWLRRSQARGVSNLEQRMRDVMKSVTAHNEVMSLIAYPDEAIDAYCTSLFEKTVVAPD
ncbi:MAG: hypothetical protein EOP84_00400 [Verrucomicrobiaceae bacterium]|nr:MAG: hypothetical protein EOP84_00400 [Verrucomicrobiaceae bacterium]